MNTKQTQIQHLYSAYAQSHACPYNSLKQNHIVFGSGDPNARFMIIGEAPGKDEDEQGIPFVGRSGRFLTKTLASLGIKRENIFITNIVKCRPPNNRKPTKKEIIASTELLMHEINIIQPRVICTLGSSAAEALLKKSIKMSDIRSKPFIFNDITVIPTYHPAYVMRNQKKQEDFKSDLNKAYSNCI